MIQDEMSCADFVWKKKGFFFFISDKKKGMNNNGKKLIREWNYLIKNWSLTTQAKILSSQKQKQYRSIDVST